MIGDTSSEDDRPIPLLDLSLQHRDVEQAIWSAMQEVYRSGRFILGPKVEELETKIAGYCSVSHGVGMSSGTDALLAALMALEVGPGQAVITTPFSFFATAGAIARLGAQPLFCDIDAVTFNIDPEQLDRLLSEQCEQRNGRVVSKKTGATVTVVMPVHLFGQVTGFDQIIDSCAAHGLRIVEDAAQAIGAEDAKGQRAGSLGDIGCFSFFPSKNLGAFGDGGMCVTADEHIADRLRILRAHGARPKYHHAMIGGNFRLDAIQAAVLLAKLPQLDRWTQLRQENARHYDELFDAAGIGRRLQRPRAVPGHRHVYNQYVVRAQHRDGLRDHLKTAGIATEIYYPVPLHEQACFADLDYGPEELPVAQHAATEVLALPVYPGLTAAQRQRVVEAVVGFYG